MKKVSTLLFVLILFSLSISGCSNKPEVSKGVNVEESFLKSGEDDSNYVELSKIKDNIWLHTTYANYNGSRTPSNGLIAISSKGIILIDTPWNNAQTKELIKLTKSVFKKDITLALITHAHEDRIGGIDTLIENNIDVRSTSLTAKQAEKNGFKKPEPKLDSDLIIDYGNINMEVFYPGEGHTVDNITVWFPQYKVLYGGCLIKSIDSTNIGNTSDANVKQWPISVKKVLEKYHEAKVVIPGHGKLGGVDSITHTLELLKDKE